MHYIHVFCLQALLVPRPSEVEALMGIVGGPLIDLLNYCRGITFEGFAPAESECVCVCACTCVCVCACVCACVCVYVTDESLLSSRAELQLLHVLFRRGERSRMDKDTG